VSPLITIQGGRLVLRDGKIGTEQACCCCDCSSAGFEPAIASNAERGLVWLEFSACIGTGAVGTVDAPQAASPCDFEGLAGPITGVTLTNGGSGYARLGRVQPTITPSVSGGSGATFSVALEEESEFLGDECMLVPYWRVDAVTVTAGGTGYSDGSAVTFTAAAGDTTVSSAQGRAYVDIVEPDEQFSIDSLGSGAVLEAVWDALAENEWADVRTPNPCPASPKRTYRLTGVTITNGGTGYSQFDRITVTFANAANGGVVNQAYIDVDTVDGNGAITAVFISPDDGNFVPGPAGKYFGKETDQLASVVVNSCVAGGGGHYYREDPSVPPYVADVTVTVQQEEPSTGEGAVVTAEVDDDTASATFGHVIALTLVNGGSGYLQTPLCIEGLELMITVAGVSAVVPVRPTVGTQCDLLSAFFDAIPFAIFCQDGPDNFEGCDSGQHSYAFSGGVAVGCIGGKLHVGVGIVERCWVCFPGDTTDPLELCLSVPLAGGGRAGNVLTRIRAYCFVFDDVDENGCPVGDASICAGPCVVEYFPRATECGVDYGDIPCNRSCFGEDDINVSLMP